MPEIKEVHRQINPNFVRGGVISSEAFSIESSAFSPTKKDNNKLSVYNGNKFTSEKAFEHFKYDSAGTMTLSYEEVVSTQVLELYEDNNPFDGHSVIDFSKVSSNNKKKKLSQKLRDYAVERGWTYRPV